MPKCTPSPIPLSHPVDGTFSALVFSDLEDENFRVWWLWETFWEFFYFAVAVAIAVIWRPNEKNLRYAFANEIPTDEMAARVASNGGTVIRD